MSYKDRTVRFFKRPEGMDDWDSVTSRFIRIMCHDPDLDVRLARLLALFATDMPKLTGDYAHHGH
jgi:hypothetical protein